MERIVKIINYPFVHHNTAHYYIFKYSEFNVFDKVLIGATGIGYYMSDQNIRLLIGVESYDNLTVPLHKWEFNDPSCYIKTIKFDMEKLNVFCVKYYNHVREHVYHLFSTGPEWRQVTMEFTSENSMIIKQREPIRELFSVDKRNILLGMDLEYLGNWCSRRTEIFEPFVKETAK